LAGCVPPPLLGHLAGAVGCVLRMLAGPPLHRRTRSVVLQLALGIVPGAAAARSWWAQASAVTDEDG